MTREIREHIKTPTIYFAISLFLFLCGLKFYNSIINYMDFSSYYPVLSYSAEVPSSQGDFCEMVLAPFYRFVSTMLIISGPILVSFIGTDRLNNIDKIDLLGTGRSEFTIVLRKIFSSVFMLSVLSLPVVLFPLTLVFFIDLNFHYLITTYISLICIAVIVSSLSMPIGVLRFSSSIGIFLNICIQVPLYLYFFENKFIPYFSGIINVQALLWTFIIFLFSVLLSEKLFRGTGIYG